MMETNVFRRYEKKFLLTETQYQRLLPVIQANMDLDPHCQDGAPYHVSTIYFDTVDNDIVRRSLNQPRFKEKLRLRKYGLHDDNGSVYLEIKRKHEGVGTKRRVQLTLTEAQSLLDGHQIMEPDDYYSRQIIEEISYYLQVNKVRPSVFISYDRHAYTGHDDPSFRLTIDSHILTRRQRLNFQDSDEGDPLIDTDHRLLEVKVGQAMPLWFAKALSAEQIYLTSFSKYGKEFEQRVKKELKSDEYI